MLKEVRKMREQKRILRAYALKRVQDFHHSLSISRSHFLNFKRDLKKQVSLFLREIFPSHLKFCVGYRSLKYEFPFEGVVREFSQIQWAYPRVEGENLGFYIPHLRGGVFKKGSFGVEEPSLEHSKRVPLSQFEAVLVPALAYDRKLRRLGRGKGYYDRALKDFKGLKIGVGYSCQVLNEDLPLEEDGHKDIAMDFVVTEKFFFHRSSLIKEEFLEKRRVKKGHSLAEKSQ